MLDVTTQEVSSQTTVFFLLQMVLPHTNYNGVYAYNSGVMDFHNNSVTKRGGWNGSAVRMYNGGLISVKNNSIANLATGYSLEVQGGFAVSESDNNNLYNSSGALVLLWNISLHKS